MSKTAKQTPVQVEKKVNSINQKIHRYYRVTLREAAKKVLLLMAGQLRGGGIKGRAIKEKGTTGKIVLCMRFGPF